MIVKAYGSAVQGVRASMVSIEVNIVNGTKFFMVGLPDNAVKESQHRIESVLKHVGFEMPRNKVIVNLAPADMKKEGASYDLPIALCILQASRQIYLKNLDKYIILGELSLNGEVRGIKGALPITIEALAQGFKGIVLPKCNVAESAIVKGIDVVGVNNIQEAIDFFSGDSNISPVYIDPKELFSQKREFAVDFSDVHGQLFTKRALEVLAAGGHNAIMIGPPGAGKTMLAKRIASILPPLTLDEALETTKIYSVIGKLDSDNSKIMIERPFRSPHHTVSDVALVGGGGFPQPGEISMAHNGILFLDELPEFRRTVLEVMRQPLEERKITISRARFSVEFPANFILVASMNPCPCGFYNHPTKECTCDALTVKRYLNKVSGPLLDRIDIHIEVTPVSFDDLAKPQLKNETSDTIRERVINARKIQRKRFEKINPSIYSNALMPSVMVKKVCILDSNCQSLIRRAMQKLGLSARAYDRILKVARTVADLSESKDIKDTHLAEAIHYRSLDRESWGARFLS